MLPFEKQKYLIAFGKRVHDLRIQNKMSLDELARKCGYTAENSRSSIQKIEAGRSDIPASKIKLLAEALNVTEIELLKVNDEDVISKESKIYDFISEIYGERVCETVHLFFKLDTDDQSEIRGEIKNMLKSNKYLNK